MITVAELNEMLEEEIIKLMCEGFDIEDTDSDVHICNRRSCYGYNKYHNKLNGRYQHTIFISKYFLDAPKEELRSVLAHEAAHSVHGSMGHDKLWIKAVTALKTTYNYVNAEYHLNAHPYSRNRNNQEHTDLIAADTAYKYVFQCEGCGYILRYHRATAFVKHPNNYRCSKCKSRFIRIDK